MKRFMMKFSNNSCITDSKGVVESFESSELNAQQIR